MRSAERMTGSATPVKMPPEPGLRDAPDDDAPHGDTPPPGADPLDGHTLDRDAPNGSNRDLCDHKQ
ncbi:hypothetical protein [Streptomyces hygroscopicus]|uniref:hypothetical protein n=1 Tax=Streptomyces hygroscopicus TaxID=1912 RepID=UPI001FCC5132|nr:hypothetical protein [Streptomyces hygroscopicus]